MGQREQIAGPFFEVLELVEVGNLLRVRVSKALVNCVLVKVMVLVNGIVSFREWNQRTTSPPKAILAHAIQTIL